MGGLKAWCASLLVVLGVFGIGRVEAQLIRGTPGYPNVGQFGGYGLGSGYGSVGFLGAPSFYGSGYGSGYGVGIGGPSFYGSGYGVGNGIVGPGYRSANQFYRPAVIRTAPLTTTNFAPLYNAITSLPSWNGTSRGSSPSPRPRPSPTVPREQLLNEDGKILWPSAAPDTPARRAAETAVQAVAREARDANQASIRHVIDARNKLNAYARESLASVKTRNAADAHGLETFIVELEKTLQQMAVNY